MGILRRYKVTLLLLGGFVMLMTLLVFFVPFLSSLPTESRSSSTVIFIVTIFVCTLLVFFVVLKNSLRPFREIADEAQIIANLSGGSKTQNESEFVMETFQGVLGRLQDQQHELELLNAEVSERAASAERFNEKIVASLPSGIIAFNSSGLTQTINTPAREFLEIKRKTEDVHFSDLLTDYPSLSNMIGECLSDGKFFLRAEISGHNSTGRLIRLGVTVAPIDDARAKMQDGVLCLLADLTEVKELREQVAIKQNLESLGEMSAGIAHEFKNSLSALHSYAQLFQRIETDERGKMAADQLLLEVRNLSEMTTAFLDFARPKQLELDGVSIDALLSECVAEVNPYFRENSVQVLVSGRCGIAQADERLVKQTIINLLRNAVEAIPADAVGKKILVRGSVVKDKSGQAWVQVEVEDNGTGISANDLPMIFVPFFTTKNKGHGIGLALSHRVISQHGGSLNATNSQNGGAIFTVRLRAD